MQNINNPFGKIALGSFGLIVADPPWTFKAWSKKGEDRNASAHYHVMTLADICALPVADLASDDCVLWLWATNPMLPQCLEVLSAWGFTFKTAGVWHKRSKTWTLGCKKPKTAFGGGYILRSASEPFLIGTRGKPKTANNVRGVVEAAVREHSRKPDEAFLAAAKLVPGVNKIELFSRQFRPGWITWGNEAGKFKGK